MKKQIFDEENRKEIVWNLINAGLAAALVSAGALTTGSFNLASVSAALLAGLIVALTKFRDYWLGEESEYSKGKKGQAQLFSFV